MFFQHFLTNKVRACAVLYYYVFCLMMYWIFPHYVTNDPIFNEDFFFIKKWLSWFFPQNFLEKFISLRRNRSNVFLHTCLSVWKCTFSVFFCSILMSSNNRFFKSVWWGTRCMNGWTDNHQEPNTLFAEMYKLPDVFHSGCYSMQQSPSSEATR